MQLNVGCGPFHQDGWVNTDGEIRASDGTRPDIVSLIPFPFRDGAFERVYLGHVLEHVPWNDLADFLTEVKRVAAPGAHVMIVGPDVYRMIDWWHRGQMPWEMVAGGLEDDHSYPPNQDKPGGRHQWNCYEVRVEALLAENGFTDIDAGLPVVHDWPMVSEVGWQCFVACCTPGGEDGERA